MRFLGQAAGIPLRRNWRNRGLALRLAILIAVVAIVVIATLLRGSFDLEKVGYGAVALSVLVASGGLVVPVPALAISCTTATFLNPLYIGLIAGTAGTVGELSGYLLGFTGHGVINESRLYIRLESWMRRRGGLVLFLLAMVPNPIFDVAGIAAGALRYPVWKFLSVVWAGKLVKFLGLAYGCAQGVAWVSDLFGL